MKYLHGTKDIYYNLISKDEEFAIYKEEIEYINNNYKLNTKFTFGIIVEMIRNKTDEFIKNKIEESIELRRKLIMILNYHGFYIVEKVLEL